MNKESMAFNRFIEKVNDDGEFPAMSNIIIQVNKIVDSDDEPASKLTEWVMQDISTTKKVLQLVNAVEFSRFGGNISSLSKAISIVGFNKIKSIVMALVIIDFIKNKTTFCLMKDALSESFLAALIASNLEKPTIFKGFEDLMVYGLFGKMSKLLVSYSFNEEFNEINTLVFNGMSEEEASQKVLGISYDKINMRIASHWNLPSEMVNVLSPEKTLTTELSNLKLALDLSAEASEMIINNRCNFNNTIDCIVRKYGKQTGLTKETLTSTVNQSFDTFKSKAGSYGLNVESVYNEIKLNNTDKTANVKKEQLDQVFAENTLQAGTQELFSLLTDDDNTIGDVFNKALDVLVSGLDLSTACVFKVNPKSARMEKMYFKGNYKGDLSFKINLQDNKDLFQITMDRKIDLVIEDAGSDTISAKIPDWFISKLNEKSFALLPLIIKDKCIGLIYCGAKEANHLVIQPSLYNHLKTIRNQLSLAIKQKINM